MNRLKFFGLFFLLLVTTGLIGQTSSKIQFKSISFADGLSQSIITCITQDQTGYMWIGTQNGLNRYDGHEIEILKATNDGKPTLPSNHIQCLLVDSLGYIWIGTNNSGLCRYDPRTNSYYVPAFVDSLGQDVSRTSVFRMVFGPKQELYAATNSGGLFRVDLITLATEVLSVTLPESGDRQVSLHDIIIGDGFLWLGSYGTGLLKYIPGKGVVVRYTGEEPGKNYNFKYIVRMINGTYPDIWISGWDNYLHRFNAETGQCKLYDKRADYYFHHSSTNDLLMQGQDSLWLATSVGGLQLMHIQEEKLELISTIDQPGGVGYNSILSLFRSSNGILWAGTNGKGLSYHHPGTQLFEVFSKNLPGKCQLDFESVRCIYADDKYLFAGGYYGMNRINLKTLEKELFIPKHPVYCMLEHPNDPNMLLIGCEGGPLYFFNKEKGVVDQLELFGHTPSVPSIHLSFIYEITRLNEHTVLLGTTLGCATFDLDQKKLIKLYQNSDDPLSVPSGEIKNILHDGIGRIWVGSTTGGLALFDPETGKFFRYNTGNKDHYLPTNTILDLLEDSKGNLWAGTEIGLIRFDPEKGMNKMISQDDGLPASHVVGIREDNSGNLWLSGLGGLSKYDPATGSIELFSQIHGLLKNEFNMCSRFTGPDGKIYFGGYDGLIGFFPEMISRKIPPPDPKFINLLIYNEPTVLESRLPYVNQVTIKPNQKFFSVEVSAFDFLLDKDAHFRYRVKEISDEWLDLNKNRIISFTKLNPSTYTLEAQVSNNNSQWFSCRSPLTIVVKPSLNQRALFKILMVLVIILTVIQIFIFRTRYLQMQKKRLNRLVEIRTAELTQSQQQLLEANKTKDKFFSVLAHDLRSPYSSMLGLAGVLEEEWSQYTDDQKREYIGGIRRNLENTFGLVNNLLDWSRLQQGRVTPVLKEILLKQCVDQVIEELNAPALMKQIRLINQVDPTILVKADEFMLSTILRNLISNAIKYSARGNQVQVDTTRQDEEVVCCVQDFGTGIPESQQEILFNDINTKSQPGTEGEKGTGLGLIVIREFVTLMNGKLHFESQPGKGSRFYFSLASGKPFSLDNTAH